MKTLALSFFNPIYIINLQPIISHSTTYYIVKKVI